MRVPDFFSPRRRGLVVTYGEMFAGYGGLGMGVQSVLGGQMAWCAEFDAAPSKILAHHWPTVPNLGDVTKVDWASVPKVDVITGGSPCQDLSHAGKRAGMKAGTRSGLWSSMCDAIETIRPRLVVWENVRGALSAEADSEMEQCAGCVGGGDDGPVLRALGRVLGDLADIGYDANWYGLRAADVGAAHGRFRVFVFATPRDAAGLGVEGQWSSRVEELRSHDESRVSLRSGTDVASLNLLPSPTVSDGNGAGVHGDGGLDLRTSVSLLPTPRGGSGTETMYGLGAERSDSNRPQGEVLLPTPRATDGTKGGPNQRGSSGDLMLPSAVQDWREYETAIRRQEQAFGRPAPMPTEPGKNGQPRLSPAFVEWLMGLPAGHVTDVPGVSRNDQLKALGNGVVCQQAAAATRAFLVDLGREAVA